MNLENVGLQEDSLVADICRDSFYDFVQEFWSTTIPQKPVWNWHIKFICDRMQAIAERVFKGLPKEGDVIINIPPGTTKSTLLSVLFPAWVWTRMPSARFICGSFTHPLALDLSRKCRDVVESEKYAVCFGKETKTHKAVALSSDQNTKGYFTTTEKGMRYAVSVGGSVTGMHAHFIIVDDPIDPNQAASDDELANANNWMNETLPSRKVDKEVAVTVLIMQRLNQNDPTGMMLDKEKEGLIHYKIPARLEDGPLPEELSQFYKDGLLDPVRLSDAVLKEAELDLGPYAYSCQYRQSPIPVGGAAFDTSKFIAIDDIPADVEITAHWRFWDKAGTSKGGNYTVGTYMVRWVDRFTRLPAICVVDVVRGQWNSGEREKVIMRTAQRDGRGVRIGVEQEPGSGGQESAEGTQKRLLGYRVTIVKPSGDKTQRADEYSHAVNAGMVYYLKRPWNKEWLKEHMYFPFGTNDDQVDSASQCFTLCNTQKKRIGAM